MKAGVLMADDWTTLRDVSAGDYFRWKHDLYQALGPVDRDGQWLLTVATDKGQLTLDYADQIDLVGKAA